MIYRPHINRPDTIQIIRAPVHGQRPGDSVAANLIFDMIRVYVPLVKDDHLINVAQGSQTLTD